MAQLFSPLTLGPIELRNRSIRAAAFEGMSAMHNISEELINYHSNVAKGEIGMTTVAYASVSKSGLSFDHQLWMRPEILPDLKRLVDSVHQHGAKVSIQLGHCGNMAKYGTIKARAMAPSAIPNLYALTFPKAMSDADIAEVRSDFKNATQLAIDAGFDAVEIHAGHGYLISQFLSPYTNKRTDSYGGSLEHRMRFLQEVITDVMAVASDKIAVLVKMNMRDGFKGGIDITDSIQVAKKLEALGVHALILSGGFVSKSPMYVMRGAMPFKTLAAHTNEWYLRFFIKYFGRFLVKEQSFTENYFLKDALLFRAQIKMPLIYIGGILSKANIDEALEQGFDGVAIARALIADTNFVLKLHQEASKHSACNTCNHCIACIYNSNFECPINSSLKAQAYSG